MSFPDPHSLTGLLIRPRYPPDTDEKKKNLGAFFSQNAPPKVVAQIPDYLAALKEKNPDVKDWAILGVRASLTSF